MFNTKIGLKIVNLMGVLKLRHLIQTKLFFSIFFSTQVSAQNIDSLFFLASKNLGFKDSSNTHSSVYVHTDKMIYHRLENIWFSAYVLDRKNSDVHHTLYLSLVNEMTQKVIITNRFVIKNGLSNGVINAPDSLIEGPYSLIAYTDVFEEKPDQHFFRQPIHIITGDRPNFELSFYKSDELNVNELKYSIKSPIGLDIAHSELIFTLYKDGSKATSTRLLSDKMGNGVISFPVNPFGSSFEMIGKIKNGGKDHYFKIPVSPKIDKGTLRYFPEDGFLVNNSLAKLVFEIKDSFNIGRSAEGILYENEVPLTTVQSDKYGLGVVNFTPKIGSKYYIALHQNEKEITPEQSFPEIRQKGFYLHTQDGVVKDTLQMSISIPTNQENCILILHNSEDIFASYFLSVRGGKGNIRIPVTDWKSGAFTASLFDKNATLVAQRPFFIKKASPIIVKLSTDSAQYKKQSKVTVEVQLTDSANYPIKGVFSLSCAVTRLIGGHFADIERFLTIDKEFSDPSILPPIGYLNDDKNTELTIIRLGPVFVSTLYQRMAGNKRPLFDGYVRYNGKNLKKPVSIILVGEKISTLRTDSLGRFKIPNDLTRSKMGGKYLLSVANGSMGYELILNTPYKYLDSFFAQKYYRQSTISGSTLSLQDMKQLDLFSKNTLSEVIVTSSPKQGENYYGKMENDGRCNDYVCIKNFLNCRVHSLYRIPQEGEKVFIDGLNGPKVVIYHCLYSGTVPYMKSINGIWYPGGEADHFSSGNTTDEATATQSTINWVPMALLDNNGKAKLVFFTNNITGKFTCVIQGICEKGGFSSTVSFNVVK